MTLQEIIFNIHALNEGINKNRIKRKRLFFPIIIFCMLVFWDCSSQKNSTDVLLKDNDVDSKKVRLDTYWKPSTPEEQGMDSEILSNMMYKIKKENIQVRSIIIVRNQRLVLEF